MATSLGLEACPVAGQIVAKMRHSKSKPISAIESAKMIKLRSTGSSVPSIAREFGVSVSTVWQVLRQYRPDRFRQADLIFREVEQAADEEKIKDGS